MMKKNVLSLVLACVGLSVSGGRYGDYKDRALPPPDTERTDIPYYAEVLRGVFSLGLPVTSSSSLRIAANGRLVGMNIFSVTESRRLQWA